MTTIVTAIAGLVALLFALGFITYGLLGENLILGALRGKAKPLHVALLIGTVIVLVAVTFGVFKSLITPTEGDFIDKITDLVMAALVSAGSAAGFLAILFGLGFLAYSLFGDFGLTGILSGKVSAVEAGITFGAVVLLAAISFGISSQLLAGDGTGGVALQTVFNKVMEGINNTVPTP